MRMRADECELLARERARRAALRRCLDGEDGRVVLEWLHERFETVLPVFQRGRDGGFDPLDAMARDAHREVVLWIEYELAVHDGDNKQDKAMAKVHDKQSAAVRSAAGKQEQEEKAKGFIEALAALLGCLGLNPRWVTVVSGVLGLLALVYFTLFASGCAAVADVRLWGEDGGSLVIQRDPVTGVVLVQGCRAPVVVQKGK